MVSVLEEPPYCSPQRLHHFTFPPTAHKGSRVSTSSPSACCFLLLSLLVAILMSLRGYQIVVLICISLVISHAERLFFFGERTSQVLCPFLNFLFFLWLGFTGSLFISWIRIPFCSPGPTPAQPCDESICAVVSHGRKSHAEPGKRRRDVTMSLWCRRARAWGTPPDALAAAGPAPAAGGTSLSAGSLRGGLKLLMPGCTR